MTQVTDLRFAGGDFALQDLGGGVFDLQTCSDNEAIVQGVSLNLDLQVKFNQYFPTAGWDWMSHLHADMTQTEIADIIDEVKAMMKAIDFMEEAEVRYLGEIDEEHVFEILVTTAFGTESIAYALGGLNA